MDTPSMSTAVNDPWCWPLSTDAPSMLIAWYWQQYFEDQPIIVNRQSIDSQHDAELSDQGSRPQTPSVHLTLPDFNLVDTDLPSPVEDFQTCAQLMVHMAKSLNLQIYRTATEPADHLYNLISKDITTPIHISMLLSLLSTARRSWTKPASSHTVSKCIDNLYRVHEPDAIFLGKNGF